EALQGIEEKCNDGTTEVSVITATEMPVLPVRQQLGRANAAPPTLPPPELDLRSKQSTGQRGELLRLPDPALIRTDANLTAGLVQLSEARNRSTALVAERAGRHPGDRLGPAKRIDRRIRRANRNKALLDRDFVTGFVRGCYCETERGTCTGECSAGQPAPRPGAWDRAAVGSTAPVVGKRVLWLVAAVIVVIMVGTGIGIYLAAQRSRPDSSEPSPPETAALYRVQASLAYRPDTETATVRWNSDI